ncbi:hypothetical protein ACFPM7_19550 [Actinokineospora guangxiensis]|uniref:Transposase n=1 Tax=Actinokineospora guangxiensis TaxID=1490288 RepID=A0ABW0EPA9_9PSEU
MTHDPDELYSLPREEFTAARKAMAKAARAAGDAQAAAMIDKLAKPTTAAWLVNRLARENPSAVSDLTALGDALRAAHQSADGPALRELTRRRTEVLRELVGQAGQGEPLSESITRELEEMFTTALLDESAGARLRTGRIASVRDLSGAPAWPGLEVTPVKRAAPAAPRKSRDAAETRKAAIAEAKAAVKAAEGERAKADKAVEAAEKAVAKAEERVREITEQLDAAEAAELEARRGLQLARRGAKEAERAAAAAWRKRQRVEE